MIDIIIVTYNANDKLNKCLRSLAGHTRGLPYLVTIVNNNKSVNFRIPAILKQKTTVINTGKNLGFSAGANFALKNTNGEFIVFLDDDAEVTPGWLSGLYSCMRGNPGIGIAGPKIIDANGHIFSADNTINPAYRKEFRGELDKGQRDYVRACDALAGACWMMRRELVDTIGYFDERFFPCQWEDIDYCIRARLKGYKIIYNGNIAIIHHHLSRAGGSRYAVNYSKYIKKWNGLLDRFPLPDSHPVDRRIASGIRFVESGRFKRALAEFDKADNIVRIITVYYYRGLAFLGMNEIGDALSSFKKYLEFAPGDYRAHSRLAFIYKQLGENSGYRKESFRAIAASLFIKKLSEDKFGQAITPESKGCGLCRN